MSDYPEGPGWWQASDQKWYPPEATPGPVEPDPSVAPPPQVPPMPGMAPQPGVPPAPGIPPAPGMTGYPAVAAGPKNNGLAIASMVTSIVSILCLGVIGIVGAILGHVALGQIKRSGGTQGGKGMAIAGIVIGWIGFALFVAYIVLVIAVSDGDGTWTYN